MQTTWSEYKPMKYHRNTLPLVHGNLDLLIPSFLELCAMISNRDCSFQVREGYVTGLSIRNPDSSNEWLFTVDDNGSYRVVTQYGFTTVNKLVHDLKDMNTILTGVMISLDDYEWPPDVAERLCDPNPEHSVNISKFGSLCYDMMQVLADTKGRLPVHGEACYIDFSYDESKVSRSDWANHIKLCKKVVEAVTVT